MDDESLDIELEYGVSFGAGDSSDWCEWETTISGEAAKAYFKAKLLHLSFDDFPELDAVLDEAREDIADVETDNFLDCDDEYVMECTGRHPVDPDEINALVAARDPHAIEYFDLGDMSDEELEEWDASDLDELPDVCDFDEDFEASSPFDGGWDLYVKFTETPDEEDLYEDDVEEAIKYILENEPDELQDYLERCEDYYCGDEDWDDLIARLCAKYKS